MALKVAAIRQEARSDNPLHRNEPDGTGNLNDMEHLKQSVRDILITPLASRVMRREYGSLVPDLIDEPMNNTTRLQCMSAAVIALTRWEPRIALDAIDVVWKAGGRAGR